MQYGVSESSCARVIADAQVFGSENAGAVAWRAFKRPEDAPQFLCAQNGLARLGGKHFDAPSRVDGHPLAPVGVLQQDAKDAQRFVDGAERIGSMDGCPLRAARAAQGPDAGATVPICSTVAVRSRNCASVRYGSNAGSLGSQYSICVERDLSAALSPEYIDSRASRCASMTERS